MGDKPFVQFSSSAAHHGGAFWDRLDPSFPAHRPAVVAADVLDAWFDPPAELMAELAADLLSFFASRRRPTPTAWKQ